MPLDVSWAGYQELMLRIDRLTHPDLSALLTELEDVIWEDNRRGVLAGTDRDDNAMPRTNRQDLAEGHWVSYTLPDGRRARYYQAGAVAGPNAPADVHDGDGPPLAPRGDDSRVITHLVTNRREGSPGEWVVYGAWEGVASRDGVEFLPFHFRGEGRLPTRDLAGLREQGLREAFEAADLFMRHLAEGGKGP